MIDRLFLWLFNRREYDRWQRIDKRLREAREIRRRIAERNADLTDEQIQELIDEWTETVNEGLREHVRKLRREAEDKNNE